MAGHFFKPREDSAVVFDSVEEALDQMTLLVDEPIVLPGFGAVAAWRDDGRHFPRLNGLDQLVAVVALIADKRLSSLRGQRQEGFGLPDVAGLPAGQHEVEGIPQGIDDGVDLGAKPAPRPAQGFVLGLAARGAGGAGVGTNNGGVDEYALALLT